MDYKVYVKDGETGLKIQNYAIDVLGYRWGVGAGCPWEDANLFFKKRPFLFFFQKKIDFYWSGNFKEFSDSSCTELTPEEFLRLKPEDVKPAPTHQEIMTKWWKDENGENFQKVIEYNPNDKYPYVLYPEHHCTKDYFSRVEGYDIPPEDDARPIAYTAPIFRDEENKNFIK